MRLAQKHARVSTTAKDWLFTLFISVHCIVGCGGQVGTDTTGGTTSETNGGVQSVPMNHRPTDTGCPKQRGAGTPNANKQEYDQCAQDSDCAAGINGRCLWFHLSSCSYDSCFSDSDCADDRPCECRKSEADTTANYCVTMGGNCRIDSDCGASRFCSPSQVLTDCLCFSSEQCGQGYFCRTPQDSCLNDSDCDASSICAYSLQSNHWTCATCSLPY